MLTLPGDRQGMALPHKTFMMMWRGAMPCEADYR
jgi:hypothetical protein